MNPKDGPQADSNEPAATPQPQVIGPQQTQPPAGSVQTPVSDPEPSPDFAPPHQQTYPPPSTLAEQLPSVQKKRPGKKFLIPILALLFIGLGASAFAYVRIMNNSPEKVLADALSNTMTDLLDKKPSRLSGTIKYTSKESDSPFSVSIDLDAKQVGDNGQIGATVHVEAGEELDISVTATTISQGSEAFYFKLDNLQKTFDDLVASNPGLSEYAGMYESLIPKLDGKWIKIDEKSLADAGLAETEEAASKCAEAVDSLRISDTDQKRVKEIFLNNQFAITSEEFPAESVEGENSYHYKLDLNEEAGLRFAKDFMGLESFSGVKEACELKQEDIDKSLDDLKKQTDEEVTAQPVFELWVGKKSRRPTKIKVTLDDQEFSMENIATIKIDAPDVTVDIPTESMTLQEVTEEFSKAYEGGEALGWSDIREDIRQN